MLLQHPHVADVCVIGVYDRAQATELPRAYVVLAGDHTHDHDTMERDIIAWLTARVARHKRLGGGVRFLEAIPKTPSGKILRRNIRDAAQKEQDALVAAGKGAAAKL
jgi:acyl-coenzyme A synthetase/AMP-(fatty) acid ligase